VTEPSGIVYVVDDDEAVRGALQNLIASTGIRVEVFPDAHTFLDACRDETPCCLVLDVGLPDLNGLELQSQLSKSGGTVPIVFLTGKGDIAMSVRAMKGGAITFLTKPVKPGELLTAIRDGIARDRADRADALQRSSLKRRYESLTPRQKDVLTGVVSGLLNKQIAARFGTQEATVKEQRAQVMQKMGAGSLAELVKIAGRLGIAADHP
jgi:FixJ family two-component response regulator